MSLLLLVQKGRMGLGAEISPTTSRVRHVCKISLLCLKGRVWDPPPPSQKRPAVGGVRKSLSLSLSFLSLSLSLSLSSFFFLSLSLPTYIFLKYCGLLALWWQSNSSPGSHAQGHHREALGQSVDPSVDPYRTLSEIPAARGLWEAPCEKQVSSESLWEGCAPRMLTFWNLQSQWVVCPKPSGRRLLGLVALLEALGTVDNMYPPFTLISYRN